MGNPRVGPAKRVAGPNPSLGHFINNIRQSMDNYSNVKMAERSKALRSKRC